jgi:hypothetical protein
LIFQRKVAAAFSALKTEELIGMHATQKIENLITPDGILTLQKSA